MEIWLKPFAKFIENKKKIEMQIKLQLRLMKCSEVGVPVGAQRFKIFNITFF